MEVGIGLIELNGRELRIVLGVHTLVAEDAPDLIDPLEAAHDEALEMELRCDAHIHIDVQGIVMGDEGPGGSAAGNGVEDRGLHLHIVPGVQIGPDVPDKLGADLKGPAHILIHDEVHIPLAEPGLRVLQPVELLRQGNEGLGQESDLVGLYGDLAALGLEHLALNAHDIADIDLFELGEGLLAQLVDADIELDASLAVLKIAEHGFAHPALGHDASSDGDLFPFHLLKLFLHVSAAGGDDIFGDLKGVFPRVLKLFELGAANEPLLGQVHLLLGCAGVLLFCHFGFLLFLGLLGLLYI